MPRRAFLQPRPAASVAAVTVTGSPGVTRPTTDECAALRHRRAGDTEKERVVEKGMHSTRVKSGSRARRRGNPPVSRSAHPLVAELDQRLLALGGQQVIHQQPDPRVLDHLVRGRVFDLPVRPIPGEPHDCHANASEVWARGTTTYTLVTGYALIGGAWLAHSWVVDAAWLYETTAVFDRYFGIALDEEDAATFWLDNFMSNRYPGPMAILKRRGDKALAAAYQSKPTATRMERAEA